MNPLPGNENAVEVEFYSQVSPEPAPRTKGFRSKRAFVLCGIPGGWGREGHWTVMYFFLHFSNFSTVPIATLIEIGLLEKHSFL